MLDFVELLFAEEDVLVFFILVTLHDFGALHVAVANGAKQGLFEPRMTHTVELVEADALAARGGGHSHGNGNQPKGKVTFPDSRGHSETPSTTSMRLSTRFLD